MRKKTIMLTGLFALLFSMAPTVGAQDEARQSEGERIKIGYAVMGMDHPLFQAMTGGAREAATKLGVDLQISDAQWKVDQQNSQLEDFIAQRVDVILINPVTAKENVPTLQKVRAAGIPVVAIDTRPIGFEPDAYVSMDHYQGGFIVGWKASTDLQGQGKWAVIWAVGNEQAASRLRGFEAGLQEACKVKGFECNFEKVGEFSGITGPLRETARQVTDTLLTKYPSGELDFIFGQTDEFAIGAYLATQAARRDDVLIYGMDNNSDMRKILSDPENKNMVATTAHLAKQIGMAAVEVAYKIKKGVSYQKEILLNFQLITKDNVNLDPGWEGTYHPSFSAYSFPEQLGVFIENVSESASENTAVAGTSSAANSAAASPAPSGQQSQSQNSLIVIVVLAVIVIAVSLFFTLRRRRA